MFVEFTQCSNANIAEDNMKNYLSVWAQDLEVLHPANIGSYSLKTPWTVFWVRDTIFAKAFVDNNSGMYCMFNIPEGLLLTVMD